MRRSFVYIFSRGMRICMAATFVMVVAWPASAQSPGAEGKAVQLSENVRIDKILGAFDDPVVVRLRTRVPPSWRGPRGEPPFTERRDCPSFVLPGTGFPFPVPPVVITPEFC